MINGHQKLKSGDEISLKATVINDPSYAGFIRVEVGEGNLRVTFPVREDTIFGRVPAPKAFEIGDNAKWNHSKVKILSIHEDAAWVRLYQPSDSRGNPTGGYASCPKYKDALRPIGEW